MRRSLLARVHRADARGRLLKTQQQQRNLLIGQNIIRNSKPALDAEWELDRDTILYCHVTI
jgi:hypothetical protein